MLGVMAKHILEEIASHIQQSTFFSLMADETTDAANKEQLVVVYRWIDDEFTVYEEFVGLHELEKTDSQSIFHELIKSLDELHLDIHRMRGQCYDGASTMSGIKNGVAKLLTDIEPSAIYTHCYGHALNLAAGDTIKRCSVMKNTLDAIHEICKLVKSSPKRDALLQQIKQEVQADAPGIRVLCPTRWTVRADSVKSILENYSYLLELWDEAYEATKEAEARARIKGVAAQMTTFEFYFGASLAHLLLRHTDNLSRTLQHKDISAASGQQVAKSVVTTLQSLRTDSNFTLFWELVKAQSQKLTIDAPSLPRHRKRPIRYEYGIAAAEFASEPEDHYRRIYYEALDLIIESINQRFDQPGYGLYSNLEQLLLKAVRHEDYKEELKSVSELYQHDLHIEDLKVQLTTLSLQLSDSHSSFSDILKYMQTLDKLARGIYSEVLTLIKLLLVMPASNATSERSFSALRRVKTYLRTTMTQERLNNLMLLHVHQESLDKLDLPAIAEEFVRGSQHRLSLFGHFV